ncbi:MAG TPA: transposase [Gaiellaceae bacterium]|nr:transposase [Gaiellaceae bacterium]
MGGVRRRDLPDGFFHVTARGVNGAEIFLVDLDRLDFIDILATVSSRFSLEVSARCLMDTHYHLVVEAATEKLSAAMQQLNSIYARRFNKRHDRRGHVFGERFNAWVIRDELHLNAALQYVADNPVRANMSPTAADWPWTRIDV